MRGGRINVVAAVALICATAPTITPAQPDSDNTFDERIRGSADAAEALQGPLDGAWTLVSAAGTPIFAFQLVDRPGGRGPVEGVWRDLRRPIAPGDIGLIDLIVRSPNALAITLNATPGRSAAIISLRPDGAAMWSGELKEGGALTKVRLTRN